jgi:hypothetical protein
MDPAGLADIWIAVTIVDTIDPEWGCLMLLTLLM